MKCLCLSGCLLVYEHYLQWNNSSFNTNQPPYHPQKADMYIVYKRGHVKKRLQQTNNKKVYFFLPALLLLVGSIITHVHLQENMALHLHDVHPFFIYLQKQASNNDSSSASDQTHYACMMQQHFQRNSSDLLYGSWNKKGELKCIIIMRVVLDNSQ